MCIRDRAHTGAQAQQAFFRALVTGHALPLGAANGAKQNGTGIRTLYGSYNQRLWPLSMPQRCRQ